ncbi:acetylornithine transaminase [Galenea microaerophila]
MSTLMNTYARLPVTFIKGEGSWLIDQENRRYLDALSGIAVCSLGHAHPAVAQAVCKQSQTLVHTSNLYGVANQQQLADKLTQLSGMEKVFFCNSGAEANETALKIARKYGHQKGIDRPKVIVMDNSFHGRTLATLSATGNPKVHAGFEPLVEGFVRVPFDDIAVIEAVKDNPEIVAILVEPIQGEGGIHVPQPGYLSALKKLCEQQQWLLMVDEVQTGIGRTGQWFAYQHEAIVPDVMTSAKALGNGVPIGACLARGQAADVLVPGTHGTTFGGNPLACAAALAVIETLEQENWIETIAQRGQAYLEQLQQALGHHPMVKQIRGRGFMFGIQLHQPCGQLVAQALEKGVLINVTREDTIRLLPPFVITDQELAQVTETLTTLINDFSNQKN